MKLLLFAFLISAIIYINFAANDREQNYDYEYDYWTIVIDQNIEKLKKIDQQVDDGQDGDVCVVSGSGSGDMDPLSGSGYPDDDTDFDGDADGDYIGDNLSGII